MTGRTALRRLHRQMAMAFCGIMAAGLGVTAGAGTAGAVIDNPDIDTTGSYLYEVNTDDQSVAVTITVDVTFVKPDRQTAEGVFQYYIDAYGLVIPAGVENLVIADGAGQPLTYEVVEEDQRAQVLAIEFRRNLFFRRTTTVVVTYDMVEDRTNDNSLVRINPAYIGLEVWTDRLLETATVEVTTPSGFILNNQDLIGLGPGKLRVETEAGVQRLTPNEVDPETFWMILSLDRPERLVSDTVEIGEQTVVLRSWPGDEEWADRAATTIEAGLPTLIDTIGIEWPFANELTVTQSFSPLLAGYAGWYDRAANEISVGDNFDDHVMLHELSHVWFGDRLSTDRWITEGLANTYAAEAAAAVGDDRPEPDRVSRAALDAVALSEWSILEGRPEVEDWAYPASWGVMDDVLELVGKDVLDDAVVAMFNDEIAYVGDTEPERHRGDADWRYFLDLLENLAGYEEAGEGEQLQQLFSDWVLAGTDRLLLSDRQEARQLHQELVDRGDEWAAPQGLRQQLARWDFTAANDRLVTAESFLDRRLDLVELVDPVGGELPPSLEHAYESATDVQMSGADLEFTDAEEAAKVLIESHRLVAESDGIFQQIGAMGVDVESDLTAATRAFNSGDFTRVASTNADLEERVDGFQESGIIRTGATFAAVVLGGWALVAWVRRRRQFDGDSGWPDPSEDPVPVIDLTDESADASASIPDTNPVDVDTLR